VFGLVFVSIPMWIPVCSLLIRLFDFAPALGCCWSLPPFQLFDGLQTVATGAPPWLRDTKTPMLANFRRLLR